MQVRETRVDTGLTERRLMGPGSSQTRTLCLASLLTLFAEVALIRWLSTEVRIFSYAKNLALLLCFLGFGVGCALASKRLRWRQSILALLALVVLVRNPWTRVMFQGLSQNLGAGHDLYIWFTEAVPNWPNFLLAACIMGILFSLLTSIFVPLGQIVSREIDAAQNRLTAYSWNLAASLFGILLFFLISRMTLPPAVWFSLILLGFSALQAEPRWRLIIALLIVPTALFLHDKRTPDLFSIWTPYQQIGVEKRHFRNGEWGATELTVNHIGYQQIINLTPEFLAKHPGLLKQPLEESPYNLPFRFAVPNPQVLVVGAGSGNDVAGAVRNHSRSVDAVEIDPVILKLGLTHPEHPYQSPQVVTHLTDARAFMKRTSQRYDLVLFGLLDSHTQGSEYANMRIDNYVYTEESIREVRNLLAPDGVLFLKFQVDRDWIGRRLYDLLAQVFGKPPVVFLAESSYGAAATCFVISPSAQVENSLARDPRLAAFVAQQARPFQNEPPVPLTTDDWPYLYQRTRSIPAVFLTLSLLVIALAVYYSRTISSAGSLDRPSLLFFFAMGAGFLLLETQTVSRLALFFGTTWQVNGIAIASILIALMIANLIVEKWGLRLNRWWVLAGLLFALIFAYLMPFDRVPGSASLVGWVAAFVFAMPVVFAGLLFAQEFRSTASPSSALSANMLGAVAGGLAENLSLVIGLKALLLIAALLYFFAGLALRYASAPKSQGALAGERSSTTELNPT